jgi:hypothetical protein
MHALCFVLSFIVISNITLVSSSQGLLLLQTVLVKEEWLIPLLVQRGSTLLIVVLPS